MKTFFSRLWHDTASIFASYPRIQTPPDFSIDYDLYWRARGRGGMGVAGETLSAWQKARADIAAQYIKQGSVALDIGSGGGAGLEYLHEKRGIQPIGADVSEAARASLQKKSIEALNVDISRLESVRALPESDYIIGFEILEHLANPEQLIQALAPKAREALIFSFPNTGYFSHRLRLLTGRFPLQWAVHPGEHLRFWTLADVRSWAPQLGLPVIAIVPYQGVPLFNRLWPALFAAGIVVVLSTRRP